MAGIEAAHIVGVSMGGFAAIHFACQHPHRVMSLTASGCGYGATPGKQRQTFRRKCLAFADRFENEGASSKLLLLQESLVVEKCTTIFTKCHKSTIGVTLYMVPY